MTSVMNSEALAALKDLGGRELVAEMATVFLKATPDVLDSIGKALDTCDAAALFQAAHRLKGMCHSMGAQLLGEAGDALETAGRAGRAPDPAHWREVLAASFAVTAAALKKVS